MFRGGSFRLVTEPPWRHMWLIDENKVLKDVRSRFFRPWYPWQAQYTALELMLTPPKMISRTT